MSSKARALLIAALAAALTGGLEGYASPASARINDPLPTTPAEALAREPVADAPLGGGAGGYPAGRVSLSSPSEKHGYAQVDSPELRRILTWSLSPIANARQWSAPPRQVVLDTPLLSDGQFVWGPNVGAFDLRAFLEGLGSPLAAYAPDLETWADFTTVNPQVLLAVLEVQHGLVLRLSPDHDPAQVRLQIGQTAMDLATVFYEHLYLWGARRTLTLRPPSQSPAVTLDDGTVVQLDRTLNSAAFALASALAKGADRAEWSQALSLQDPGGFAQVFDALFPNVNRADGSNNITPTALPPDDLFQFPFPLGARWSFNGPHSWAGGSYPPPFSSMDFSSVWGACSAPPNHYSVAAAPGNAVRPYGYSCWLQIDHGGGWVTSYYHLRYTEAGGAVNRNDPAGAIGCEVCAGGFSTAPHVHFSVKYNGAYVSIEGVQLSGWTVHVGNEPYTSGFIERDDQALAPYNTVLNDYQLLNGRSGPYALRFYGNGGPDIDRVKIQIDDPLNSNPGPPADVGWQDFTIEFWLKASPGENGTAAVECGENRNWTSGNVLLDRDRVNQDRKFGLSLAGGRVVFGVTGDGSGGPADLTICGTTPVDDGEWHHVAVQRNRWDGVYPDGHLWLWVDGLLEASAAGPGGDVSYPDNGVPGNFCGLTGDQPCTDSDPYLVIGAAKDGGGSPSPSFRGWIDELRISNLVRYYNPFTPPLQAFTPDANTIALIHFNEGAGDLIFETSGFHGGPSNGQRKFGGDPAGPQWVPSDLFLPFKIYLPLILDD